MNLKKVKDSPKGVEKLYKELDNVMVGSAKVGDAATPEEHAEQVEKFISDLPSILEYTDDETFVKAVDGVVSKETSSKIANEISKALGIPESVDETLWDYIQHALERRRKLMRWSCRHLATLVVAKSEELSFEDKLIIVDEVLANE